MEVEDKDIEAIFEFENYARCEIEEYFDYLVQLQHSGATNMFGAGAYLSEEYDIGRKAANKIVTLWMKNYTQYMDYRSRP